MEYICHRRYKKRGASGKKYLFTRGTRLQTVGDFIAKGDGGVCLETSEDAHMYFARNDDGKGIERGKYTYQIAYAARKPNLNSDDRFTSDEITMLERDYPHYLRQDTDTILFNNEFFNAPVEDLKEMYRRLQEGDLNV